MSFDLVVQPCRYDGTMERRVNPFTKAPVEVPRNAPLSATEAKAVRAILDEAAGAGPDEHGRYVIRLVDGTRVDAFARELAAGCTFMVRAAGVSAPLAALLHAVLVAGNWVLLDEDHVVAPHPRCVETVLPQMGEVVVVRSSAELVAVLTGGTPAHRKLAARAS